MLGYLFRATSGGILRVAGLGPIEEVPGLENVDVTTLVAGHMAYRTAMPRLLREVGWSVDGDEFVEIEDPVSDCVLNLDKEAHAEKQPSGSRQSPKASARDDRRNRRGS